MIYELQVSYPNNLDLAKTDEMIIAEIGRQADDSGMGMMPWQEGGDNVFATRDLAWEFHSLEAADLARIELQKLQIPGLTIDVEEQEESNE